ncbi:DNA gyrase inhibitor YacG [Planctomycetota bacterium]
MSKQCPICRKAIHTPPKEVQTFLPFCSERCKLVDLNAWLDSDYRIPTPLSAEDGPNNAD